MGLEELTFDVEGVKVILKPELHLYHNNAEHEPFLGCVPVIVAYSGKDEESVTSGTLRYDTGKRIFITALSDFLFPTEPNDFVPLNDRQLELLEKYKQGMSEVARVYSALLHARPLITQQPLITEKNFYKSSQGEWKDIGYWYGVFSHKELLEMADAAK